MENFCKRLGGRVEHELLGEPMENGFVCRLDRKSEGFIRVDLNKERYLELCIENECIWFGDFEGDIEIDSLLLGKTDTKFTDTDLGTMFRLWRDTDTLIVRKTYNSYKISL